MSDHTWTCTHPNISVLTREDFWGQEPCKHKSTSHVIPLATLVTIPLHSSKRLMGHLRICSFLCGWTKGKPNPKTWESWMAFFVPSMNRLVVSWLCFSHSVANNHQKEGILGPLRCYNATIGVLLHWPIASESHLGCHALLGPSFLRMGRL